MHNNIEDFYKNRKIVTLDLYHENKKSYEDFINYVTDNKEIDSSSSLTI